MNKTVVIKKVQVELIIFVVFLFLYGSQCYYVANGAYFNFREAENGYLNVSSNPIKAIEDMRTYTKGVTKVAGLVDDIQKDCFLLKYEDINVCVGLPKSELKEIEVGDYVEVWGIIRCHSSNFFFIEGRNLIIPTMRSFFNSNADLVLHIKNF